MSDGPARSALPRPPACPRGLAPPWPKPAFLGLLRTKKEERCLVSTFQRRPTRPCKIPFSQARGSLCAAAGRTAGRLISGPRNWSVLRDVRRGSLSPREEVWP